VVDEEERGCQVRDGVRHLVGRDQPAHRLALLQRGEG
jgi:hypothetical protein